MNSNIQGYCSAYYSGIKCQSMKLASVCYYSVFGEIGLLSQMYNYFYDFANYLINDFVFEVFVLVFARFMRWWIIVIRITNLILGVLWKIKEMSMFGIGGDG